MHSLNAAVSDLARRQHGVVTNAQVKALGVTDRQIEWALKTRRWHSVHRGVHAVGHPALTHHGRYMAAVLAAGDGAVLSHRSAASLWGLQPHHGGPVHVLSAVKQRPKPGIRAHWTRDLPPHHTRRRQGIAVTSLSRTLTDLADLATAAEQEEALRAAERIHGFDRDALRPVSGRRGAGRVRGTRELTRGHLERLFLRVVDDAGLSRPKMNVSYFEYDLDAVWWEARVAAEIDDWDTHRDRASFTGDRRRDRFVTRTGLRPVRITHDDLTDGRVELVEDLRALGVR